MFFTDFLFALFFAFLLTSFFGTGFRRERWSADIWIFFTILLLVTWTGGVWITPMGPLLWGVPWLTFFLVGLFFAILITALTPMKHRHRRNRNHAPEEVEAIFVLDLFFWILIIGTGIALIASYI